MKAPVAYVRRTHQRSWAESDGAPKRAFWHASSLSDDAESGVEHIQVQSAHSSQ
eukprot:CAMPEP_0115058140 /NCGR_PEP_ID=MMETSP0227-20121206/6170_1 /TAXON_ID=89957 /ORGANISM="Polarella glacialis, Strain CCMP 1383" /LENGTH=53 /DNA_ID=CAMNT_0002443065 /DNA_START=364 /DNA_END=525 /DNA_ORIENTATION=-